jgi:hypothetical protein
MIAFRDKIQTLSTSIASLSNQALRLAIAKEVLGWVCVRQERDGCITGSQIGFLSTVPLSVPDWMDGGADLEDLEATINRNGWMAAYRRELENIAGAFNPNPTNRQRCEAALATARLSPMDR